MIEVQAVFPVMVTPHLEEVRRFYETVFGFNAVFHEPGFYLHLVSPHSGGQLGFLAPGHESQPPFLHPLMAANGYVISLEVADAASAYTAAEAKGLDIVMPLKDETWGQRHFMVTDPAGFRVDVVQHLKAGD